jgi:hypothetical protein
MERMQRGIVGSIASGLLLLVSAACFNTCDPEGPPEPFGCEGSVDGEATVDEIRLARVEPFYLLEENDATETVIGGQGLTMLMIRLAWRGGDEPECGKVRIRVFHPDTDRELASREADVASSVEDGWRAGSEFYFIVGDDWSPYEEVRVEAEAFGRTTELLLRYGGWPPLDGGFDGGMDAGRDAGDDAGPIPMIDAGRIDAGVTDAGSIDGGMTDAGAFDAGM